MKNWESLDWFNMFPQKSEVTIQWSHHGWVRVKTQHTEWRYAKCAKAEYAETVGVALLRQTN